MSRHPAAAGPSSSAAERGAPRPAGALFGARRFCHLPPMAGPACNERGQKAPFDSRSSPLYSKQSGKPAASVCRPPKAYGPLPTARGGPAPRRPPPGHPSQARERPFRLSLTVPPDPFHPMASNSRRFTAEMWMARTTAALAGQSNTGQPLSNPSPVLT
ncbi:hypothetical protein HMPREF0262_00086 [Clostridium sp. ATCC 29733]|nr:hypothetical protein HMPREF0262_00086 [Clostridium sp. ATCC 29733]